ncbi:MAG: ABC transporter ATP-binding protein [Myxococcota bacterium]|jgi:putative ABC transport system ATP-binding protein|nr:ABC transporter ATP-binding protein [Myxococcota bacterium]
MTDKLIEVNNLSKVYTQGKVQVHALRGVELSFARGDFAALAGPSGSGKSTLLNLIGCLDRPSSGSISIDGRVLGAMGKSESARFRLAKVGFIFQAYNLIPVLSAYENAEFTLYLQGVPAAQRRARVIPLMERVGLAELMHRKPHEMSGGQQQRVAVVRAIASMPAVVLADEPTANLDSESAQGLLDLLAELNVEHGISLILASHDPLVLRGVRRVIRLRDGQVLKDGHLDSDHWEYAGESATERAKAEPGLS